ncbi:transcriptional regulator SlyA [Clostridiales bacterium]|nr:transcriptional regulator SlyA [Clostridiales bacterium]
MICKKAVFPEIKCISNIINRYMAYTSAKCGLSELTVQQMHILRYINEAQEKGDDIFQRDIETKLNVRPPTATKMLKILEKNGYIIRESISCDARFKRLVLTDKTKAALEKVFLMIQEAESCISDGITQEELEIFFNVIDKMKLNLCTSCDKNCKHQ